MLARKQIITDLVLGMLIPTRYFRRKFWVMSTVTIWLFTNTAR
jgi:hypothetical protein